MANSQMNHKRKVEVELSADDILNIMGNFGLPELTEIAISLAAQLSDHGDKYYFNKLKSFIVED